MNLIEDKELSDIIKKSEMLTQKYIFEDVDHNRDSYWKDRRLCRYHPEALSEYGIDTPARLKAQLKDMWKFQECDYMGDYAVLLTIAAFKNRFDKKEDVVISDFIYEF